MNGYFFPYAIEGLRRKCAISLLLCLLLLPVTAAAGNHSVLFDEAADMLDNDYANEWAFTETASESDITTVARYNPAGPGNKRWNLLTVNGRVPTDEEIEEFREDKADDPPGDGDHDPEHNVEEMVQPDSLLLIEETDDHWLFNFMPAEDEDDEGLLKHVDATLKIVKGGPYIEFISLQSSKPFKPQFGVKISEFVTLLVFGPAAMNGPIVPVSVDIKIKARAFLAISIDETISISFSDYEYVGDRL